MAPPIVKRFMISLDQHKWLGLLTILAGTGISAIFALQPPAEPPAPTYTAIGRFAFSTPPPAFTTTGTQLQQIGRSLNRQSLLAPRVIEQVLAQTKIPIREMQEIIQQRLKIIFPLNERQEERDGQEARTPSNVITLEYTDPRNPERAKMILEVFMTKMIEQSRWLNTSQLRERIQGLEQRLASARQGLNDAEEAFYRYISKEGSALLAVQDGSLLSAITSSQQQQRQIRLQLDEIRGRISSIVEQLGLNPEQALTSSVLSSDPILANLRAQILQAELEAQRLAIDLRPEHPRMVELRKQQQSNELLLQQRAAELLSERDLVPVPEEIRRDSNLDPSRQSLVQQLLSLETQQEGLIQQLDSLVASEQQLRGEFEAFPDKQLQQAQLVQAVETQRILYRTILRVLVDAQSAEAETTGSLVLAQAPTIQPSPRVVIPSRNVILILAAGTGLGAVGAFGLIFLLATLDDRMHSPPEIQEALVSQEVLMLGQLPLIWDFDATEDEDWEEFPVLLQEESSYLSFYERFRSNLRRLGPDASSKLVLVTSTVNEEGKSLSAYNLAIASAQAGKRTLLIEADLRQPTHVEALGIEMNPEANEYPLRYYAERSDAISLVPEVENLYIVPSPGPQRQAAAILESSELQQLFKDARGRFDLVIVDTPSLLKCNDALLLEPLSDGIVLVTRPGTTRRSLLREVVNQFEESDIPLLGAVINGVEDLISPLETDLAFDFEVDEEVDEPLEAAVAP